MKAESQDSSDPRPSRGRPRDWHDKTAQNTIKSLDRAMAVFEHLSEMQGANLTTLASETEQSPATVYRILVTLETRGLVEFDAASQQWHVGPRAFLIGARFLRRTNLVERARPVMRRLMERTGETANLGIEQAGNVLFVMQVETHESIRAFFPPGTLSPMHASGIGKTLLSQMDQGRQDQIVGNKDLERFTEYTLCDADALRLDLRAAHERGYAIDGEEKNLGMRCIAAPVFDAHGQAVAGISVSGPTIRMSDEQTSDIAAAVLDAARDLTEAIGGVIRR